MSGSQVREGELEREASDKKNACMNEVREREILHHVLMYLLLCKLQEMPYN